jgi:hypothetical protein
MRKAEVYREVDRMGATARQGATSHHGKRNGVSTTVPGAQVREGQREGAAAKEKATGRSVALLLLPQIEI